MLLVWVCQVVVILNCPSLPTNIYPLTLNDGITRRLKFTKNILSLGRRDLLDTWTKRVTKWKVASK